MSNSIRKRAILCASTAAIACGTAGVLTTGSAQAANGVCDLVGIPSSSQTIQVPPLVDLTIHTCNDAKTPPAPSCSHTIDVPGVAHIRVFFCGPLGQAARRTAKHR
jgi:hypothetical protein